QTLQWVEIPKFQISPIPSALTVYTDAGRKSHTAAITWQSDNEWHHHIMPGQDTDSLQTLELMAVVWAIYTFTEPLNIVSDSLYVVGIVQRIEASLIKDITNKRLHMLMM
ncbi:POK19 protein, partial [Syrrhaptes paradoxus]|nr:POK19 protein [Syrrhaptes paradoxus]